MQSYKYMYIAMLLLSINWRLTITSKLQCKYYLILHCYYYLYIAMLILSVFCNVTFFIYIFLSLLCNWYLKLQYNLISILEFYYYIYYIYMAMLLLSVSCSATLICQLKFYYQLDFHCNQYLHIAKLLLSLYWNVTILCKLQWYY